MGEPYCSPVNFLSVTSQPWKKKEKQQRIYWNATSCLPSQQDNPLKIEHVAIVLHIASMEPNSLLSCSTNPHGSLPDSQRRELLACSQCSSAPSLQVAKRWYCTSRLSQESGDTRGPVRFWLLAMLGLFLSLNDSLLRACLPPMMHSCFYYNQIFALFAVLIACSFICSCFLFQL